MKKEIITKLAAVCAAVVCMAMFMGGNVEAAEGDSPFMELAKNASPCGSLPTSLFQRTCC